MSLYAVIMAGGVGERFWPESRSRLPKQYLNILGGKTLIQETVERVSQLVPCERILVVSSRSHETLLKEQLPQISEENLLLEPVGRNTAPCIALAAAVVLQQDADGVMAVMPADHLIGRQQDFLELIKATARIAFEDDCLATIGIVPASPETGYGYIHRGELLKESDGAKVYNVREFIEKPPRERAQAFLRDGQYLWNSGMFVWKAGVILEAIRTFLPEVYAGLEEFRAADSRTEAIRKMYERVPKVSIDHGVMEKARNIVVATGDFLWDDVGSWSCLERHLKQDPQGNVVLGHHAGAATEDSIIVSRSGVVATMGVKGLIIVSTPDAVLVIDKSRAQEVKTLLELMRNGKSLEKYL